MSSREGSFYSIWPVLDGKPLNLQWGQIRSNTSETKAIVRNSFQELEDGEDELNALRSLLGLSFGDIDFRNRFRFFYDQVTDELCCQTNTGTVDSPVWVDSWCVRFHDGQFQVVSQGGINSSAGFYGEGLQSIEEVAESGSEADNSVLNPTKLFFNTDDGLSVETISSGANSGQPEIRVSRPFGQAQKFEKAGKVWRVDHNYGISPLLVQVMDSSDRIIIPEIADVSDPNTAWFYFNSAFSGSVYIASGGVGAASLVPQDPFYLVVRHDEQNSKPDNTFESNCDLIFDSEYFYVNPNQDSDAGGAHKTVNISLTNKATGSTEEALLIDGSNAMTAPAQMPDGTESAPGLTFSSDNTSGLFLNSSGDVAVTVDGTEHLTVEKSAGAVRVGLGGLEIPDGTESSPGLRFSDEVGNDESGIYRPADGELAISANRAKALHLSKKEVSTPHKMKAEAFYLESGANIAGPYASYANITPGLIVGDPGTESGSITLNGSAYSSNAKISDIDGDEEVILMLHRHHPSRGAVLSFTRSDAYGAAHSNVGSGDILGSLVYAGWNSSSYEMAARIDAVVDGDIGTGYVPGRINFRLNDGQDNGFVNPIAMSLRSGGYLDVADSIRAENKIHAEAFYLNTNGAIWNNLNGDLNIGLEDVPGAMRIRSGANAPAFDDWIIFDSNGIGFGGFPADSIHSMKVNGRVGISNGDSSYPAFSFINGGDTGIFLRTVTRKSLGFSLGGVEHVHMDAQGVHAGGFYFTQGGEAPISYHESFALAGEWQVNHGLKSPAYICQAYHSNGKLASPTTVDASDPDVTYFYFAEAIEGRAVILGLG